MNTVPYSVAWGQSIYAKVSAINAYGSSTYSEEGNGGIIITNPDAPRDIVEDITARSLNSIAFSWS